MKKINLKKKVNFREIIAQARENRKKNKKRLKHGSYSMAVTGIVIASVVVFIWQYRNCHLSTEK